MLRWMMPKLWMARIQDSEDELSSLDNYTMISLEKEAVVIYRVEYRNSIPYFYTTIPYKIIHYVSIKKEKIHGGEVWELFVAEMDEGGIPSASTFGVGLEVDIGDICREFMKHGIHVHVHDVE